MRRPVVVSLGGVLLLLALAGGVILWQRHRLSNERAARQRAELQAGVDASRVLTAVFDRASALRVARLSGRVQSLGTCESGNFIPNEQHSAAPYSVDYLLDLGHVTPASYRWDAGRREMLVDLPDISVEQPNIDMARAVSEQTGIFVSRACGLAMQGQVAGRLRAAAADKAGRPEYLDRARELARSAIGSLVRSRRPASGR